MYEFFNPGVGNFLLLLIGIAITETAHLIFQKSNCLKYRQIWNEFQVAYYSYHYVAEILHPGLRVV